MNDKHRTEQPSDPSAGDEPGGGGRELDLVVFGATGFTGGLVAEYLAANAPQGLRIGLAGRNRSKLAAVARRLGPAAADWPLLRADSGDAGSLREMAESTRAIVTTVGPYTKHGLPLVAACARAGTNYADLTAEVVFMRDSIDQFDEVARSTGARIVHSCGFDSIPSDLGVLELHRELRAADGEGHLGLTQMVVTRLRGGYSGGTIASGIAEIDRVRADPRARRTAGDPYGLSPRRDLDPDGRDERDLRGVDHDDLLDTYLAPFVMAPMNSRVVRRSNALADYAYGRDFRYRETLATGPGLQGRITAGVVAAGTAATFLVLSNHVTRKLAGRFLPDPGEGPDAEQRARGSFEILIHTTTSTGACYQMLVAADGDPGYAATSVMLAQTGMALAGDQELLPAAAGVLTPATGLGEHLIERLRGVGFTFTASRC